MNIVLAKIAISVLCTGLLVIAFKQKKYLINLSTAGSPAIWLGSAWIGTRLLPFILIYLILGVEPTSDVNGFWYMATHAVLGDLVYRDFWSPYSPLFSYFLGIGSILWNNPRVVVLMMILMEGIAVLLSWHYFKPHVGKSSLFFYTIIYFLLPGSLILSVVGAQEDVWMWLFYTLAFILGKRKNNIWMYSFLLAIGVLMTKAIFVLFLVPLFFLEKEKWRFALPLASVGLASVLWLYFNVGDAFLQPMGEADTLRAPNIISVLNPWFFDRLGAGASVWNWVGLVVTLLMGGITTWKWRHKKFEEAASYIFIIMYATLMIVQQSAYSNYIFIFLLPLALGLGQLENRNFVRFILFYTIVCVIHPSYWWRLGMPKYLSISDIFQNVSSLIDYVLQASIVLLTIGLIVYLFKNNDDRKVESIP